MASASFRKTREEILRQEHRSFSKMPQGVILDENPLTSEAGSAMIKI